MKKVRFTEERMVTILREADRSPVAGVARKHKISELTTYVWRRRFGKLEPADVKPQPNNRDQQSGEQLLA